MQNNRDSDVLGTVVCRRECSKGQTAAGWVAHCFFERPAPTFHRACVVNWNRCRQDLVRTVRFDSYIGCVAEWLCSGNQLFHEDRAFCCWCRLSSFSQHFSESMVAMSLDQGTAMLGKRLPTLIAVTLYWLKCTASQSLLMRLKPMRKE